MIRNALIATISLLVLFFAVSTLVSGFALTLSQFKIFWYFLVSLAAGFGVQVGLYSYLKRMAREASAKMGSKTVALTGATSALTMISCCAHYLVNIVPVLGVAGALSVAASYQTEIFWAGIAFNLFGIVFIARKITKFKKEHLI